MNSNEPFGEVYTTCKKSYRGKAERRQREYRVNHLKSGWDGYGHLLDKESAAAGNNFILPLCHDAARKRDFDGKGVGERTFQNMLSSQAMCFNIFEPLNADKALCQRVFSQFIPGIKSVNSVTIEYTPDFDIFQDQQGKGGVDCDVLVEAVGADGKPVIVVIETKFVEPEFSICGYRKPRSKDSKIPKCPEDVPVKSSISYCSYVKNKTPPFLYWQRTLEHAILRDNGLADTGCPFGGAMWQLWVNYLLAHEEAKRRSATNAYFAVCASAKNTRLLNPKHNYLEQFKNLVSNPESVILIDIDELIRVIRVSIQTDNSVHAVWLEGLMERYSNIG